MRPHGREPGRGTAIKVKDAGMISHTGVRKWLVARRRRRESAPARGAGGRKHRRALLQVVRAGVPAGCVSIPCRYIHTTSETADIRDALAASGLLLAALSADIDVG